MSVSPADRIAALTGQVERALARAVDGKQETALVDLRGALLELFDAVGDDPGIIAAGNDMYLMAQTVVQGDEQARGRLREAVLRFQAKLT